MKAYALLLVLVGLVGGADAKDDGKKDKDKIQGAWKFVSAETEGKAFDQIKDLKVVFSADKLKLKSPTEVTEVTFKLDPSSKPMAFDLSFTEGGVVRTFKGIYELKGDDLKVCIEGNPEQVRPKKFPAKTAGTVALFVLKREQP